LVTDDNSFRNLIVWLEDQKIRHYKVEDRLPLRKTKVDGWTDFYRKYLIDLDCPIKTGRKVEEVDWLLSFSVALEFEDNKSRYQAASISCTTTAPVVSPENSLDNLDFNSPDFVQGVNLLATVLKICPQPNHLLTLKAISKVVQGKSLEPKPESSKNHLTKRVSP